jgi:hypothetical protein
MRTRGTRAMALGAVAAVAVAAPAVAAFGPPVVSVRYTMANSIDHGARSDWMSLTATPTLNWLGGYELGYVVQDTGTSNQLQRVGIQVLSVPDGHVDQPMNATPFCSGQVAQPGSIVPISFPLQYEGNGTYTVKVAVGPPTGGSADCLTPGPNTASTTVSFAVNVGVAPVLTGKPLSVRLKPQRGDAFVGVKAADPPGGGSELKCARDAKMNADGSVSGKVSAPGPDDRSSQELAEKSFTRPGAWTCVARGLAPDIDNQSSEKPYPTPWSAPLRFEVHSDFLRQLGRISSPRSRRPKITFTAQFPEAAVGGKVTFHFRQVNGCKRTGPRSQTYKFASNSTSKGRFGARTATVTLHPPAPDKFAGKRFFLGTLDFGGTHFLNMGTDPNASYLVLSAKGLLSFVSPTSFPLC